MNAAQKRKYFAFKGKASLTLSTLLLCLGGTMLSGCASMNDGMKAQDETAIYDPFETTNRYMMSFNTAVDYAFVNPVVQGYRTVAPQPVRSGIRNFLRNLRSPITFANQLLQGDIGGAGDVLVRTAVNTTVGVGGIFDVAGHEGIKYEPEDFGQTLAVWGVGDGPYMVVPFIGPSSLRDYTGYFADSMADPLRMYLHNVDEDGIYYAKVGVDYLDIRESVADSLKELKSSSIDYYAAVRSAYFQHRAALIADHEGTATNSIPAIPNYEAGDE
jgi:phospholipid-binding lipoprotein MlaA